MFSRIEGSLREKHPESVVVETGGLCYEIMVPGCVAAKLAGAGIGDRVALEIYPYIQIDGNRGTPAYVGFTNAIEREFFEALLTVASVGPKTAARAFSRPMAEIARYIDEGDRASLQRLPGIGDQKAKDIVAKLQGKVARFGLIQGDVVDRKPKPPPDFVSEAIEVLVQLQYRRGEAERMAHQALEHNGAVKSADELLTEIWKHRSEHAAG